MQGQGSCLLSGAQNAGKIPYYTVLLVSQHAKAMEEIIERRPE
jgi:hypothetical protein